MKTLKEIYLGPPITDVVVGETDGTETLASSALFDGIYVSDTAFLILGKPASDTNAIVSESLRKPTKEMNATVHELVKSGNFTEIFGSFSEERGRWQESQIVRFCRDHRVLLGAENYANFFELEGDLVVRVNVIGGTLKVNVFSFLRKNLWTATYQYRFVFLKWQ